MRFIMFLIFLKIIHASQQDLVNCPNVKNMGLRKKQSFDWTPNCQACELNAYRKDKKSKFLMDVNCIPPDGRNLTLNELDFEYFDENTYRGTVINFKSFGNLSKHILWRTFFKGAPSGLGISMETMDAYVVKHKIHEQQHEKYETGVSKTNWIFLSIIYLAFGIMNLIQFCVNDQGAWY